MVQLRNDCDCKTCKGGSKPHGGRDNVFGGWICTCPCHQSGFPVDSNEHLDWMREENRKHLMAIIDAENSQNLKGVLRMKNEEMITNCMTVETFDSIGDAPSYEEDWAMLKVEKALIVAQGTVAGNPTVDIQMVDSEGKKFVVMATSGVLEMLVAAIKGVKERTA
jgi:hypothetical protein